MCVFSLLIWLKHKSAKDGAVGPKKLREKCFDFPADIGCGVCVHESHAEFFGAWEAVCICFEMFFHDGERFDTTEYLVKEFTMLDEYTESLFHRHITFRVASIAHDLANEFLR